METNPSHKERNKDMYRSGSETDRSQRKSPEAQDIKFRLIENRKVAECHIWEAGFSKYFHFILYKWTRERSRPFPLTFGRKPNKSISQKAEWSTYPSLHKPIPCQNLRKPTTWDEQPSLFPALSLSCVLDWTWSPACRRERHASHTFQTHFTRSFNPFSIAHLSVSWV